MARRYYKAKSKISSKSQAKAYARNHGTRTPPSGAQSGPVSVRMMTPEERVRYSQ